MQLNINSKGYILMTLLGLSSGNPLNHIARTQPTILPSSIEYNGCWCEGTTLYTFTSTNITLKNHKGQVLANAEGTCSYYKEGPEGTGCSLLGDGDVTVGGYLIHRPDAYFGPCGFNSSTVEISIPGAKSALSKNLTVSCFSGTDSCATFGNICASNTLQASTITGGSV